MISLLVAQTAEAGGVTSGGWQMKVVTGRCCRDGLGRSFMAVL